KNGSQILTRGSGSARSDGGTIIGMATATARQTTVEKSAVLDVSAGSAQGSLNGTIWLGDRRQSLSGIGTGLFRGATQAQLIPIDLTVSSFSTLGSGRDTSLVALNNLTVTGVNDLSNFSSGSPNARLRLIAG